MGQVCSLCGLAQVGVNPTQCFHSLFLHGVNLVNGIDANVDPDP